MLNSVNTNVGAMVALESLNQTNSALQATEKQISTGYRVADAVDDGAAYAVAQGVRSSVSSLTSANQQLGNVQGLLSTTTSALNSVSNMLIDMRSVLVKLADGNTQGDERTQYQQQYNQDILAVKSAIQDASYNGKTLIGNITGSSGTFGSVAVVRNEVGSTYGIATFSGSAFFGSINITSFTSTAAQAQLTATGTFQNMQNTIGIQLNLYGSATNYVSAQTTYNSNKIDALNSGLGSLIDADLSKESAQLTSLQIRQQLGTQSLSIANQAPSTLLKLFG
ncbi:MAG: flagellin [Proteobacteria bacterium]|nr:flagellin [Pseudomonadota bacterium]